LIAVAGEATSAEWSSDCAMRTRTSPSPGVPGSSDSKRSTSGPPNSWKRIVFDFIAALSFKARTVDHGCTNFSPGESVPKWLFAGPYRESPDALFV